MRVFWIVIMLVMVSCSVQQIAQPKAEATGVEVKEEQEIHSPPTCGDGVCQPLEITSCPSDCTLGDTAAEEPMPSCGNGICEGDELVGGNCDQDCAPPVDYQETQEATCGNGICEEEEIVEGSCQEDCG